MYAVMKIRKDNSVMIVNWTHSKEEAISEAEKMTASSTDGSIYRAVREERYGHFESVTDKSLHNDN